MINQFGVAKFGSLSFGGGAAKVASFIIGNTVAVVGDSSSHGGLMIDSGGNIDTFVANRLLCIEGALHLCPIPYHGTTPVTAITIKSFCNGKKIVTYGAISGCGAIILPPRHRVVCEG